MYGQKNYRKILNDVEAIRASRDGVEDPKMKLRRPYDDKVGVFPCRSFNIGTQSVSYPHVDERNMAQAWCSVTALGQFNANLGGHLALWDLRALVRFPPGSTILIPSALLLHSNASIQPGEERFSIVQYVAGGLGRWMHYGQRKQKDWRAHASLAEIQEDNNVSRRRWAEAVEMYTHINDLKGWKSQGSVM